MITEDDIRQAERDTARTASVRDDIERAFARGAVSVHAHEELGEAQLAAEHAAARLADLVKQRAAQVEARTAREAAGRAAAEEMAGTAKGLVASREAAARAVAQARAAAAAALAEVARYDQAVRAASAQLAARGLRADDGDATGARRDGGLRLDGEAWLTTDGPSVLGWVLAEAITETTPRHPLAQTGRVAFGAGAVAGRDALLARVRGLKGVAA
jgi:hypothetical protein